MAREHAPCLLPSCLQGSSSCQDTSPEQRQDQLSPSCICWRFLSPSGIEMGLPVGFAAESIASKLSFSSLQLQPIVSCSVQKSSFLPAASFHPRNPGICLPPPFPGGGRPQEAATLNGFADLWQVSLPLAMFSLFISHLCYMAAPKTGHTHRQDCGRAGAGAGGKMLFLYLPTMLLF